MEGDLSQVSAFLTDPPPSMNTSPTSTVKMEDLHHSSLDDISFPRHDSSTPTPSLVVDPSALSASSQSSEFKKPDAKQPKKRKSWGQVLPEPKTSLPPRKRAKTDDEKEQRRIERVKRNRLAAHNSRERKRQEVELLQAQNDALMKKYVDLQVQMKAMAAELRGYRTMHGDNQPLPELPVNVETSTESFKPVKAPSVSMSSPYTSPESLLHPSFDSPSTNQSLPSTPAAIEHSEVPPVVEAETQHSAAMLSDPQCHSCPTSHFQSSEASQRRCFQPLIRYLLLLNMHLTWTFIQPTIISTLISTCLRMSTSPTTRTWFQPRTSSTSRSARPSLQLLALFSSICTQPTLALQSATSQVSQLKFSASMPRALGASSAGGKFDDKKLMVWCRLMTRAYMRRRMGRTRGIVNTAVLGDGPEYQRKWDSAFDSRS